MAETALAPGQPARAPAPPAAKQTPKNKRHYWWIWVVLAALIAVVAWRILSSRRKPPPPPPPPVVISTTNAHSGSIDITVTGLGAVTPVYTVAISPRVDGQLMSVNYTEGEMVKTNDLLVEIDPKPFEALLMEAEGQLARDAAQLEAAQIDLQRYQSAYEKKAIPQQQVGDQQALVHQDEGTVKLDEGQVTNAQVQLNYCFVRAPINGRVGLRLVDPGNVVHAANTNAMVVVIQLQPMTVIFSVAEDYLPQIMRQLQNGRQMRVEAYDRAQERELAAGLLLTIDNMIDPTTGTVRIKAVFPNEDLALFPNQFVNAKLIIDTLQDAILIPTPAIQRNPQGTFVYVVTNSVTNEIASTNKIVTMRNITPGVTELNVTAVEGLDPDEVIATDNFNKLGEGTKVILRKPGEENQPGGREPGKKGKRKKPAEKRDS